MEVTLFGKETVSPDPIYASKYVLVLSEKTKPLSITPFMDKAPQGLPVAEPW